MRIRIIQPPTLSHIDGIRVDCYRAGYIYDVAQSVGEIFLAEDWAEPAPLAKLTPPPLPEPIYQK